MSQFSRSNNNTEPNIQNQTKNKTAEKKQRNFAYNVETNLRDEKLENTGGDKDTQISEVPEPVAYSTPKKYNFAAAASKRTDLESRADTCSITDQEILLEQTLKPGEPHPEDSRFEDTIRAILSVSRDDLYAKRPNTEAEITGIPDNNVIERDKLARASESSLLELSKPLSFSARAISPQPTSSQDNEMGSSDSRARGSSQHKNIMNEDPEIPGSRKRILESEVTGNCRPWSDHVFYKLFLDIGGRKATLMVIKCEITYVDVFTDEEHTLYRGRFIGGKKDGVAQMFSFDLMKSRWEEKVPPSQAIELNVDIVMSASPLHQCSETLLNLLQLEKAYLKHRRFDGQLNIMLRFAHSYGWETKDEVARKRTHTGLRNLFREGVNLEVMNVDVILEEMRVDGILATNDEKIKHYTAKRHAWKSSRSTKISPHSLVEENSTDRTKEVDYNYADAPTTSTRKSDNLAAMTDSYYVTLHDELWNIIQDTRRINRKPEGTEDTDDSL